jgi:hypothetical protein
LRGAHQALLERAPDIGEGLKFHRGVVGRVGPARTTSLEHTDRAVLTSRGDEPQVPQGSDASSVLPVSPGKAVQWGSSLRVSPGPAPSWPISGALDVLQVRQRARIDSYWEKNSFDRKKWILRQLRKGLLRAAGHLRLSKRPFEAACEAALRDGLVNDGIWLRPVLNKTRTATAELAFRFDQKQIALWAVIRDRRKRLLQRLKLAKLPPHDMYAYDAIGRFKWFGRNHVVLTSRDGQRTTVTVTKLP